MSDVKPVVLERFIDVCDGDMQLCENGELGEWTPWEKAQSTVTALQAEIVALRKDAERYRWLRHGDNDELVIHYGDDASEFDTWLPRTDDLDLTIDAAIAKEKQQESLK